MFDTENQEEYKHPFGKLIKKLWPGRVQQQLCNMNKYVKIRNEKGRKAKVDGHREAYREMKKISEHDYWRFVGIMILATVVKKRGTKLWDNGLCGDKRNGERRYNRFTKPIDLGPSGLNIMPEYRFGQIKDAFSFAFDDGKSNPWS